MGLDPGRPTGLNHGPPPGQAPGTFFLLMGWSFRESIKILPGVRLNFSRKGVSASVGTRGLRVGVGGGRAPRVTGGVGPLRYYQSMGTRRRQPRYLAPTFGRVLVGAGLAVCLLLGLLWVPSGWFTTRLQAAAPQYFPASWAAGYVPPAAEPSQAKSETARRTPGSRHEPPR